MRSVICFILFTTHPTTNPTTNLGDFYEYEQHQPTLRLRGLHLSSLQLRDSRPSSADGLRLRRRVRL
jgi:hypothetical protein